MIRDQVIETLRARQADLLRMGVVHAAVFGSVARGDDRTDSDVDLLVDVDPIKVQGIFALGRIHSFLEECIGRPVDLARRDRLRPGIAKVAAQESISAF